MKERSIILEQFEARAFAEDRATALLRVMKVQPPVGCGDFTAERWETDCSDGKLRSFFGATCGRCAWCHIFPFGEPGDVLLGRETFAIVPRTAYARSDGVQQVLRPDDEFEHDAAIFRAGWTRSSSGIR